MASLSVSQYDKIPEVARGALQIPMFPRLAEELVSFSGSAGTLVTAFGASTRYVMVVADAAFHYQIATSPTATTAMNWWPANLPLFFGVEPGSSLKISAIAKA